MTDAENPIRICIVEDHQMVREALAGLISTQTDMEVVSCCGTVEETLRSLSAQTVDLILLDLNLGADTGISLLEELPKAGLDLRVLVVAALVGDQEAFRLVCSGAAGVVLKTAPLELLLTAIRKVAAGEPWFDHTVLKKILERTADLARQSRTEIFTPREKMVLRHVLNGRSNKEIGEQMNLRESSVKSVMQSLFDKAGVRSRAHLVRIALERFPSEL